MTTGPQLMAIEVESKCNKRQQLVQHNATSTGDKGFLMGMPSSFASLTKIDYCPANFITR